MARYSAEEVSTILYNFANIYYANPKPGWVHFLIGIASLIIPQLEMPECNEVVACSEENVIKELKKLPFYAPTARFDSEGKFKYN